MLGLFKSQPKNSFLKVDIHSHLLPGLDDGVKSFDESINIIKSLKDMGIEHIVTTPHIISDYYPNTPESIQSVLDVLKQKLKEEGLKIKIEAAAEYFVDDWFIDQVQSKAELLTFGDKYILIETAFMNYPLQLQNIIFDLAANGYKPVLAHPERYDYLIQDYDKVKELVNSGALLQVNAASFFGYYSKESMLFVERLVEDALISFIGSDIHNQKHLNNYKKTIGTKLFNKVQETQVLNNSLLNQ